MKIKIKYILIVLILIQSASANPINDPSFEYGSGSSISANWTHDGDMTVERSSVWKTNGSYSCNIHANDGCDCMGSPVCGSGSVLIESDVYQMVDFTNVDNITFAAKIYTDFTYSGHATGNTEQGIGVKIGTEYIWWNGTSGNTDNTFSIDINTSLYTGIQKLSLYATMSATTECLGCEPGECSGSHTYNIQTYFDNFTAIYTPSPPIPKTTTFDNLFNCSTIWCMLTVVFSTYEDECSGGGLSLFWTIIVLIPFMMTWIKQQSVIIPSILALITGSTLFALLPDTAMSTIIPLLSIGVMGLLYHIIKSR